MSEKRRLFIGIDLNDEKAMVSFFTEEMKRPETVSTIPGEERFQIPTAIFCTGQGNYFYGEEAIKRQERTDGNFFSNLYEESLDPEHVAYRNMLVQFIRRLMRFKEKYDRQGLEPYLAVSIPEITDSAVGLFEFVRKELDLPPENFQLMDRGESFFAYTYHQDETICRHDAALIDFRGEKIFSVVLHADGYGAVKRVAPAVKQWKLPEYLMDHESGKDEFFANVVREAFQKRVISGVFFIGDGFDGGWMQETLRVVGPNKRVFLGKNLYTLGACYAGYRNVVTEGWHYYYDGPYKLRGEISLKVMRGGAPCFLRLTQLGENWFTPTGTYYFLYDGDPSLDVWIRIRQRMNARIENFTMDYIPERDPRSIRLCVQAVPVSGSEVIIRVSDDGFGDLFESTGKVWEFPVTL
ncbi:MAG: DUF5716 family protein [Lachnospiraceae bacterium]|nr:DUF5716 family protein [Lachnospiraceae bacterium]